MIIMTKYCSNCGNELNDNAEFCDQCGASQKDNSFLKDHIMIIGLLSIIIIILLAFLFVGVKAPSELTITSGASITTADEFSLKLTADGAGIANENVHIVFDKDGEPFEFDAVTDKKGKVSFVPDLDVGKYKVACKFDGNAKYKESYADMTVYVKENEPDYESFYYTHSFAETDKNGDGYVLLSDMHIVHTPENIRQQMYADSDDNHDGKLNEHEYYKFMYKLNYDKHSYGL